jgi:hypothetical protein
MARFNRVGGLAEKQQGTVIQQTDAIAKSTKQG